MKKSRRIWLTLVMRGLLEGLGRTRKAVGIDRKSFTHFLSDSAWRVSFLSFEAILSQGRGGGTEAVEVILSS